MPPNPPSPTIFPAARRPHHSPISTLFGHHRQQLTLVAFLSREQVQEEVLDEAQPTKPLMLPPSHRNANAKSPPSVSHPGGTVPSYFLVCGALTTFSRSCRFSQSYHRPPHRWSLTGLAIVIGERRLLCRLAIPVLCRPSHLARRVHLVAVSPSVRMCSLVSYRQAIAEHGTCVPCVLSPRPSGPT
jgi:hypothetical protein